MHKLAAVELGLAGGFLNLGLQICFSSRAEEDTQGKCKVHFSMHNILLYNKCSSFSRGGGE